MANDGKFLIKISADIDGIRKDLDRLNNRVNGFTKKAESGFSNLTTKVAKFGLAVNGLQQGIQVVSRLGASFVGFEKSMTNVNTLLSQSSEEFKKMTDEVAQLSRELPSSASELADGLYQVISAGVDAGNSINFLDTATRSAVAGVSTSRDAVHTLTSVINAYGMEADDVTKVSDILFKVIENGVTTFPELSSSLGNVITQASVSGTTFEELSSSFALLTKSGMNSFMTSTAINSALTELYDPTSKANKLFKEYAGTTADVVIQQKGLTEVIRVLSDVTGTEITSNFGQRGARAVNVLTQNFDEYKRILDEVTNSTGATADAFEKQMETISSQSQLLKNEFNFQLIRLGNSILPMVNKSFDLLNTIFQNSGKTILAVTGYLFAMSVQMNMVNGSFLIGVKNLKAFRIATLMMNYGLKSTLRHLSLLRARLISTGIGAVIVGLSLLAEKFFLSGEEAETSAEKVGKYKTEISNLKKILKGADVDQVNNAIFIRENEFKKNLGFIESYRAKQKELTAKVNAGTYKDSDAPSSAETRLFRESLAKNKRLDIELKKLRDRSKILTESGAISDTLTEKERKLAELKARRLGVEREIALYVNRRDAIDKTSATIDEQIELEKLQIKINQLIETRDRIEQQKADSLESGKLELEEIKARRGGIDAEITLYTARADALDLNTSKTIEEQIEVEELREKIEQLIESRSKEVDAFVDAERKKADAIEEKNNREYELGLISKNRMIELLQERMDALANQKLTEEEYLVAKNSLEDQMFNLQMERYGRLRLGAKEFLKGEAIDWISQKQIKMLAELATIFATSAVTFGLDLAPKLAYYGAGLSFLEMAKTKISAFAKGGYVDQATLGLIGEAGAEVIAPEKDFKDYAINKLTPMIQNELNANISGTSNKGIEKKLDELIASVNVPGRTIVRGTDIVEVRNKLRRGRV